MVLFFGANVKEMERFPIGKTEVFALVKRRELSDTDRARLDESRKTMKAKSQARRLLGVNVVAIHVDRKFCDLLRFQRYQTNHIRTMLFLESLLSKTISI